MRYIYTLDFDALLGRDDLTPDEEQTLVFEALEKVVTGFFDGVNALGDDDGEQYTPCFDHRGSSLKQHENY